MTTTNQGMSFLEIEQIIAQRVANDIETIVIYEAKTRMARDLMNWVEWQEDKVEENASNKRQWEGGHGGSSSQQQNKEHKVIRAHTVGQAIRKAMLKIYHCVTSASFTTLARVRKNMEIASGLVIKLEIVGP
ncbi:hypothetical protein Tco_0551707, partial [Tanacetum coccineum]